MTIYYISTSGNDTTGDGSIGNPWASFNRAKSSVAAGDTVKCAAGVYQENSASLGYLSMGGSYADWVTYESQSGADDVIIESLSSTTHTMTLGTSRKIIFRHITWRHRDNTVALLVQSVGTGAVVEDVVFDHCVFTMRSSGTSRAGVRLSPNATQTVRRVTFTACTWTIDDLADVAMRPLECNMTAVGGVVDSITLTDCTITGGIRCAYFYGATNVLIDGGSFTGGAGPGGGGGVTIGVDGESAYTSGGIIRNVTVSCTSGHAILIGSGANSVVVDNVTVTSCNDYAVVVKENSGVEVKNCHLAAGTLAAVLLKACTLANVHNNVLTSSASACLQIIKNSDNDHLIEDCTVTYNRMIAAAGARCLDWKDSDHDAGGSEVDHNIYRGLIGNVRGVENISTLSDLRAAWDTYDVPTNDDNSRMASARTIIRAGLLIRRGMRLLS